MVSDKRKADLKWADLYEMQRRAGPNLFPNTIDSIKQNLEKIKANTLKLKAKHKRALEELRNVVVRNDIHILAESIQTMLRSTRDEVKSLTSITGESQSVKQTQQKVLAKKLMDTSREFQDIQSAAKRNYKHQMERQYRIARPNASAQQVQQALSDTNGRVFQQELSNSRTGEQRAALEQVQSRHTEIELIEQSIEELFNLFQDMQLLLDTQQERIDIIDAHTDDVVVHLEDASKQLTSAISSAKNARKRKWILFGFFILVTAAGMLVMWFYAIKPWIEFSKQEQAKKDAKTPAPIFESVQY